MSFQNSLGLLRITGIAEGLSFLILLFVAMPLKYYWGKPEMVSFVGMAHGVLFVLYIALTVLVRENYNWSWKRVALLWIGSVVPFGTFYADVKILRHESVRP